MIVIISVFYRNKAVKATKGIGFRLGPLFLHLRKLLYVFAFSNTTVANSTFTIATAPFITALLAWLVLKETISKVTIIAMASACFGVILIVLADVTAEGKLELHLLF